MNLEIFTKLLLRKFHPLNPLDMDTKLHSDTEEQTEAVPSAMV